MVRLLQMVHLGQETVAQKDEVIFQNEEVIRQKDEVILQNEEVIRQKNDIIKGTICFIPEISKVQICHLATFFCQQ
jgi:hypothetical protein